MFSNPQIFEPLFVNGPITADQVKDMIHTTIPPGINIKKQKILHTIGVFLDHCTEEGTLVYIRTDLNSPYGML